MSEYREFLKSEGKVQLFFHHKALAAQLIILTYNDLNTINRYGLPEEDVLSGCRRQLKTAIAQLEKALKIHQSENNTALKPYIRNRTAQIRNNTRFLKSE